jgi:hypothetical protein
MGTLGKSRRRSVRTGGRTVGVHRVASRFTRLAPGAIAIVVIVIGAGFLVTQANPAAAAGSPLCIPSGLSVTFWNAKTNSNATNGTTSWDEAPAGLATTFEWGNTTSYNFGTVSVPVNKTFSNGSGLYTAPYLNYLDPSSTYYFKVSVYSPPGTCPQVWAFIGSWNTQADSSIYVNGTVYGASGSGYVTAPSGVEVYFTCARPNVATQDYWDYAYTDSYGQYSFNIHYGPGGSMEECNEWGSRYAGFNISVHPPGWNGYFNETVYIWDAQTLNFYLPISYESGYTPAFLDFMNSPANYSQIYVGQGTAYENSYTYQWVVSGSVGLDVNFGGGMSGSTTNTAGFSNEFQEGSNNGPLCWAAKYSVSGAIGFSAFSRGWSYLLSLTHATAGNFCSNVGLQVPQNWIPNGTSAKSYFLPGPSNSTYVDGMTNVTLWNGEFIAYSATISSTVSTTTSVDLAFGLSGSLPGGPSLSLQASATWSQSVSVTSSTTFSYTLNGPGSGVSCYNVIGEGGSFSKGTADFISIVYWAGHLVGGIPKCP